MKQDNFEHTINKKLDQAGQRPEAWNTPPEGIFDAAMLIMNPSKKRKRRLFILPLLGILLITLAGFYFVNDSGSNVATFSENQFIKSNNNQITIEKTQSSVTPLSVDVNNKEVVNSESSEALEVEESKTQNKKSTSNSVGQSKKLSAINNSNKSSTNNSKFAEIKQAKDLKQKLKSSSSGVNNGNVLLNPTIKPKLSAAKNTAANASVNTPIKKNSRILEPTVLEIPRFLLSGLPIVPFNPKAKVAPDLTLNISNIDKQNNNPLRRSIGLSSLLLNSKNVCSGITAEMENIGQLSSLGLSLSYEQSISTQWAWGSSISWSRLRSTAIARSDLLYNSTNETTENGMTYYNMSMDVETPFGLFSSAALFPVDPSMISDDELIKFESKMGQRLELASIHFTVKRYFGNSSKLRFFAGPQIGYNHILNLKSDMDMKVEMYDQVMMEMKEINKDKFDLKRGFISVGLKMGFEKRISENSFFILGLGGSQSLFSLRKSNSVSLKINQLNASIGFIQALNR